MFLYDVAEDAVFTTGLKPSAPTDSSTILIPAWASDLGLSADASSLKYTVEAYSIIDNSRFDSFGGTWATYDGRGRRRSRTASTWPSRATARRRWMSR